MAAAAEHLHLGLHLHLGWHLHLGCLQVILPAGLTAVRSRPSIQHLSALGHRALACYAHLLPPPGATGCGPRCPRGTHLYAAAVLTCCTERLGPCLPLADRCCCALPTCLLLGCQGPTSLLYAIMLLPGGSARWLAGLHADSQVGGAPTWDALQVCGQCCHIMRLH